MSLSKSLRRILDERNMTVAELARKSSVPAKTIYHWLAGQQPRKMEHVFYICDALGMTVEQLYERAPPSKPVDLQESLNAGVFEVILRPLRIPTERK